MEHLSSVTTVSFVTYFLALVTLPLCYREHRLEKWNIWFVTHILLIVTHLNFSKKNCYALHKPNNGALHFFRVNMTHRSITQITIFSNR